MSVHSQATRLRADLQARPWELREWPLSGDYPRFLLEITEDSDEILLKTLRWQARAAGLGEGDGAVTLAHTHVATTLLPVFEPPAQAHGSGRPSRRSRCFHKQNHPPRPPAPIPVAGIVPERREN